MRGSLANSTEKTEFDGTGSMGTSDFKGVFTRW